MLVGGILLVAFGMAGADSGKQVAPNHNVGDPNERVCETITPISIGVGRSWSGR